MNKIIYLGFYNIFVLVPLRLFFRLCSPFNKKIKAGLSGRRRIFSDLNAKLAGLDRTKEMVWFHASSMGEFEQAKPVIQRLKAERGSNVLASFFSPSGYKNNLRYEFADIITYMPEDSPGLAKKFICRLRPSIAVFMRYDIWPNHLIELRRQGIPTLLVDATLRGDSKRFMPISFSFHKMLFSSIDCFLTVGEEDAGNFLKFGIPEHSIKVAGDTRYDRVYQKSLDSRAMRLLPEELLKGKKIFVAGSSWPQDEAVLFPAIKRIAAEYPSALFIIVPHEPVEEHLHGIESELASIGTMRYSRINSISTERVLIVDAIGVLLSLYSYADVAYVGGSFKQGIHNVLEPAVYGIPVLFGPKIERSVEAGMLLSEGGAFVLKNSDEAYLLIKRYLFNEDSRINAGKIAGDFVKVRTGATEKILSEIYLRLSETY